MRDPEGKNITILGAGLSGTSLALAASRLGARVFVTEEKPQISRERLEAFKKTAVSWELGGHTDRALECDFLVLSSCVSPSAPLLKKAAEQNIKILGEVDFAVPRFPGKVIAITGTNGKTTTASLTAHLLKRAGFDAVAAGNIGCPLGDFIGSRHRIYVVELSSFQLYWASESLFDLSVITNIAPDHLDWHGGFSGYLNSKKKALTGRKKGAWAIVQSSDKDRLGVSGDPTVLGLKRSAPTGHDGIYLPDDKKAWLVLEGRKSFLFSLEKLPLLGSHNAENAAMAAAGSSLLTGSPFLWEKAFDDYVQPPHRCQFVVETDGVVYVDDSKGTNVASTCTALRSIEGTKVIILGGRGKGESYGELAKAVKESCRHAVLIGEESGPISKALSEQGFGEWETASAMEEAVRLASSAAKTGDTVLLSPSCTSWDMYSSYEERGDDFRRISLALACEKKSRRD